MGGVNNFITDLIDGMKATSSTGFIIYEDSNSFYQTKNGDIEETKLPIRPTLEEIREDLLALGFVLQEKEIYYYRHDPNGKRDKESTYLSISMQMLELRHTVVFRQIESHSLIRQELQHTNPMTAQEYRDYAY
jgi:hypothetical protein